MKTPELDPRILLRLDISKGERWDDQRQQFFYVLQDTTITLEHSLVSVYKWEAHYHKPFMVEMRRKDRTIEEVKSETYYYFKCMTLESNVPDAVYRALTSEQQRQIDDYINDPATATTFMELPNQKKKKPQDIETAEVIYWEMFQCGIPIEWEHRHFNQLVALIRVCAEKNNPGKKMPQQEVNDLYMSLNEKRKKALHTRG